MKSRINKEELEKIASKSLSVADMCRALNIRPNGSNYKTIKSRINEHKINVSHFTGSGWNCGKRFKPFGKTIPLSEILVENSTYMNNTNLKKRLINEGLKINKCEKCGIDKWQNDTISIQLHHIDENNMNNKIENLILLCPNCHSQMHKKNNIKISSISEYRKNKLIENQLKESLEKVKTKCIVCGNVNKRKRNNYCSKTCYNIHRNNESKMPHSEELMERLKTSNSVCEIARHYNVSDNTIRKWLKKNMV